MADIITAGDMQWPLSDTPTQPADVSDDQWALAQQIAIDWIWGLSGRQFGQWNVVFRPEWTIPVARSPRNYVLGEGIYGRGLPAVSFDPNKPLHHAPLPGPVVSVTSVMVDGVTLPSTAYELNGDTLLRVDGGQWYRYQDTTQPDTAAGTWQISYLRGVAVPAGGQYAAAVLAHEEARRMSGDTKCRLPNNTSTVARNGATVSLDAKQPQQGFTTLREVDQWCRIVNPNGRQQAPQVWSPDLDPALLRPIPTDASAY